MVQPPAAALILSLLFLAWLLFALCHLFPVSSFVRPLQAPSTPPPFPDQAGLEALEKYQMGDQYAQTDTNMSISTGVCPNFAV